MRKCLYIGLGGFAGAALRSLCRLAVFDGWQGALPLGTLLINVAGAFALALVLATVRKTGDLRDCVTVGLLGAFTTFSALCRETVELLQNGEGLTALCYVALSLLLGLTAAFLGSALGRGLASAKAGKGDNE